ncbi:hypothetical protein ACIRPU_43230 [Streptomyces sp. NPDC102259]|uniref:hypothetical protein n=1 Tax=Streptomyces sp. NPDC102259 TaxID=3366148 RepID=UPI0038179F1B
MPRMLRMPGKDVLPPGPKRDLVAELFVHYRLAMRPPLPKIAALTGTESNPQKVSRETIRRLLTGTTTSQWGVVDALLLALCQLQDRDPDGRRWPEPDDSRWDENDPTTCREHLRRLWNDDIDGLEPDEAPATPPAAPVPPARQASGGWGGTPQSAADDPWAAGIASQSTPQTRGYSDEPPF